MLNTILGVTLEVMMAFVSSASGLDPAPKRPAIVWASPCEIVAYAMMETDPSAEFCKTVGEKSSIVALYDDERRVMMLPEECKGFNDVWCQHVFVHEYTHHLQNAAGMFGPARRANCLGRLEPLAYRVANAWVSSHGHPEMVTGPVMVAIYSACVEQPDYERRGSKER